MDVIQIRCLTVKLQDIQLCLTASIYEFDITLQTKRYILHISMDMKCMCMLVAHSESIAIGNFYPWGITSQEGATPMQAI